MTTVAAFTQVKVIMTLDEEEAQFLRDLLGFVGGDRDHSRRVYADRIIEALEEVGFSSYDIPEDVQMDVEFDRPPTVYFNELGTDY